MKIMRLSCLFLVVSLPEILAALTGRTCTVKLSRRESYIAYQQGRRSQRYSISCGFLGWSSCTRYRDYYVQESVVRVRTVYYARFICCPGWRVDSSGSNCNIYSRYPTLVACPKNTEVRATGKLSGVTWQKPQFEEPFGYGLNVTSTFGGEEAQLPWGDTRVIYVATSQNNNKQVRCAFTITVIPPRPEAVITGFGHGESISVDEYQRLVLQCRAEYGKPPPALTWFRNGSSISVGSKFAIHYRTITSDYLDYKHAISTLIFRPTRRDDGVTYECRTTPNVSNDSVKMNVTFLAGKRIECDFSKSFLLANYTDWVETVIQDIHVTRATLRERKFRLESTLPRLEGHISSFKSRARDIVELNATYDIHNTIKSLIPRGGLKLETTITDIDKHVVDGEWKLESLKRVLRKVEELLKKWEDTLDRLRRAMLRWKTFMRDGSSARHLTPRHEIFASLNSLALVVERSAEQLKNALSEISDYRREVIHICDLFSVFDYTYNTLGDGLPQLPRVVGVWIRAELHTTKLLRQLSKEYASFLDELWGLSRHSFKKILLSFRCTLEEITSTSTKITQVTISNTNPPTIEATTTNAAAVTTPLPMKTSDMDADLEFTTSDWGPTLIVNETSKPYTP